MKIRTIWCTISVAAIVGGTLLFSPLSLFSAPPSPTFAISLPATSVDFSDLDLRDELNRPVKSKAAVHEMQKLFVRGLNRLLMFNLTPQKRTWLLWMATTWDTVSGWLKKGKAELIQKFDAWLQKKRELTFITQRFNLSSTAAFDLAEFGVSHDSGNRFLYLVSLLIASTHLLR